MDDWLYSHTEQRVMLVTVTCKLFFQLSVFSFSSSSYPDWRQEPSLSLLACHFRETSDWPVKQSNHANWQAN